ncbi:MAG: CpaF family protein [Lachnospiraceae bacterium]|nr:CpaF family protein [Lachnospiraceae bacterium]
MDLKNKAYLQLANLLVEEFYKKQSAGLLSNLNKRNVDELSVSREKILREIREQLSEYQSEGGATITEEEKDMVMELIDRELWGYGIIDPFIHEADISDIKIYGAKRVMGKEVGQRIPLPVEFDSEKVYLKFVSKLLERNKINLGTANAIQTFTDTSLDDFILRITVISALLTDSGLPVIAVRKIPKNKYDLMNLTHKGMFQKGSREKKVKEKDRQARVFEQMNPQLGPLIMKMIHSKGILFTGKGASGKTTLMNAMIAEIPHDESVMICQENAELFDLNHPDLFGCHVLTNTGDSKISYELGDLTRAALLVDLDRVIVGEVKNGSEAAGLSKASMTGHKCWTSVHGESCQMAVDKMADYISQATGYSTRDALKQLLGFEYVVHLKNFRVDEVVRIAGWNTEEECLIYETVYRNE